MNEIIVSFDQQMAVRISDGLPLKVVPDGAPGATRGCLECAVPNLTRGRQSCSCADAANPLIRCCNMCARKDGLNVTWRPT